MNNIANDENKGRLLIVDDDRIISDLLSLSLGKCGYLMDAVESGEECLAKITDINPDVIIMDIDMPGIDGIQTCQKLKEQPGMHDLPIIFLSSSDNLKDRLRAYEAGAHDFIGKPFNPEEIRCKVDVAMRMKASREKNVGAKKEADNTAMTAIFSLGELGAALKFTRDSLSCKSLKSLANLAIHALKTNGIDIHVQLRSQSHGDMTVTVDGLASPLEISVIEMSRAQGRIFQFSKRLIVNYESVSILVLNLPIENEDLTGRIRDYVAIICETCEAALENILLRLDANARAEELQRLVEATQIAIMNLQNRYRLQQADTRFELDQMIHAMEDMYITLGLLESQEKSVSQLIHAAKNKIMDCFEKGTVNESEFNEILARLEHEASYSVLIEEDQFSDSIDLW